MARIIAKIGNYEVLSTNKLIIPGGEVAFLFPFDDDPDYRIDVDIKVSADDNEPLVASLKVADLEFPLLTIRRPFAGARSNANSKPYIIAEDEKFEYGLRYTVSLVGNKESHVISFEYVVLREARSGSE